MAGYQIPPPPLPVPEDERTPLSPGMVKAILTDNPYRLLSMCSYCRISIWLDGEWWQIGCELHYHGPNDWQVFA